MWRRIWKILKNFLGTKQGLNTARKNEMCPLVLGFRFPINVGHLTPFVLDASSLPRLAAAPNSQVASGEWKQQPPRTACVDDRTPSLENVHVVARQRLQILSTAAAAAALALAAGRIWIASRRRWHPDNRGAGPHAVHVCDPGIPFPSKLTRRWLNFI